MTINESNLDVMTKDEVLLLWEDKKEKLKIIKEEEMDLRKYIVKRAFPNPEEGVNRVPLGETHELKAGIKFTYNLDSDINKVEQIYDKIALTGNHGSFIAERLISWQPQFHLKEYRELQAGVEEGNKAAIEIKKLIDSILTIDQGAPTLEIKEMKKK